MIELQEAIKAIKAGDKQAGEQLLRRVLETEPDNEAAWLWLATTVDNRSEKTRCLAKVLEINPDNDTAQRGITRLHSMAAELPAASPEAPARSFQRLRNEARSFPPAGPPQLTWDEIWFSAVSRPSVATFEHILHNSRVSAGRAFWWLAVSSVIAAALGFMLRLIVERLTTGQVSQQTIIVLAVGITLGPIVGVAMTAVTVGFTQWAARLLGGQGTFNQLLYAQVAFGAPLGIIIAALAPIPFLNLLNIILYLYAAVLNILAIRAVNRLSTGQAIVAVLIPSITIGLLVGCGVFLFVFTLAGMLAGR